MKKGAERENRYFRFLKRLRAGGRSNMYGAIPYLSAAFGCDRNEAFRIVCEWVDAEAALHPESNPAAPRRQSVTPLAGEREPTLFDAAPAVPVPVAPARPAAPARRARPAAAAPAPRKQAVTRKKAEKGRKASRRKAA